MKHNISTSLLMTFCLFGLLSNIAIAAGGTASQIKQLSAQVGQKMNRFSQGIQRWGTGQMSDTAASQLFKTRLIPISRQLKANYKRLENLGKRLPNKQDSKQVQYWSRRGSAVFSEWDQVLSSILRLHHQKNKIALANVVKHRLPLVSQHTAQFLQGLSRISPPQNKAVNYQMGLLQQQAQMQAQQRSIQMMSNMNRMQHETSMAIINNMGSTTRDHYENGAYMGNW
ncbi:MAG: hypothetical protein KAG28_08045 [Cocleimonas sp.]|nr:hypothetical protein [Cocleimonas sp.]